MEQDKEFLGKEPVGKLLFRLAIPTILAQLINMLYNIVDRIYIGHIPGDGSLALTGVGVCMPVIMIISAFAALLDFTAGALRIYCGVLCIFGIQVACQMTFVSLGNAPSSILVAIVRKFILLLPLIYLVPRLVSDKTMGVYLAEPIADVLAVSFTAVLFYLQFKKSMSALEAPVPPQK